MDCSLLGTSVHGISQARILEWVSISSSREFFPTLGLNLCLLHWQADSSPLSHLGSQEPRYPRTFGSKQQNPTPTHFSKNSTYWNQPGASYRPKGQRMRSDKGEPRTGEASQLISLSMDHFHISSCRPAFSVHLAAWWFSSLLYPEQVASPKWPWSLSPKARGPTLGNTVQARTFPIESRASCCIPGAQNGTWLIRYLWSSICICGCTQLT